MDGLVNYEFSNVIFFKMCGAKIMLIIGANRFFLAAKH
jgi:hypothetical protein